MQKTGGHPFSVTNHRSWQTLPGLLWTFGDLQRYDLSESVGLVCSPMMMVSSHGFSHGFPHHLSDMPMAIPPHG